MNSEKYIGLDVHQAIISVGVLDHSGRLAMECILETKAATILEFFAGLRGTLSVTFEEGDIGGLVIRSAPAPYRPTGGVQSPEERSTEGREQERPDRCSQTGRTVTRQLSQVGLPRRNGCAYAARMGTELSDHDQGSDTGDESAESSVSLMPNSA
jgi:hypothetical protein